jgi:hypothetical protein
MSRRTTSCPDCEGRGFELDRRHFLAAAGAAATAAALPRIVFADDKAEGKATPETLVKKLYDTLTEDQRKTVAFAWDHEDPKLGLLRTRVSNNWHITAPEIAGSFYTKDQQEIARAIYEGLFQPEWVKQIDQQLQDDNGGKAWGAAQNIAIFGKPGEDKFELVMTGRHMTVRVDGNSIDHMAFGGPTFHGHAASGFNEKVGHPGNIWWPQALAANEVFKMLDGKQREKALVSQMPAEQSVGFRGTDGQFQGIPISELTADQKELVQKTVQKVLEPYRNADRDEALECLKKQGGLDKCSLAFYSAGDLGDDEEWDNLRLEGPSFVWYFRGTPHVHMWTNIGADASVKLNA